MSVAFASTYVRFDGIKECNGFLLNRSFDIVVVVVVS